MLAELAENFSSSKGKYGQKLLNIPGPSPVRLRKNLVDIVLGSAVAPRNFGYKMFNNPEKHLYVASDFLPTSLTTIGN